MTTTFTKGLIAGLVGAAAVLAATPSMAADALKFAMQDSPGSIIYKGTVAMKEELEKLSGKALSFDIFPSEQLGGLRAAVEQVQEGEIDFTAIGYPDMSYLVPELKVIGEPYVVRDYDHFLRILNGPYGKKMDAEFAKQGVRVLDVWYSGTRQTTSNKAINSIADMKGLKLRTPNVDFLIDFAQAAGAKPVPVAFQEVYLALQTNQVDAEENPLPTIDTMKFYEVQSHIALTNHFVATKAIVISDKTWQKLGEKERGWITQAAQTARKIQNDMVFGQETALLDAFKKRGITVTEPDTTPFREAMRPYYDRLDEKFGKGAVEALIQQ